MEGSGHGIQRGVRARARFVDGRRRRALLSRRCSVFIVPIVEERNFEPFIERHQFWRAYVWWSDRLERQRNGSRKNAAVGLRS